MIFKTEDTFDLITVHNYMIYLSSFSLYWLLSMINDKSLGGRNGYGAKLCNIFSTKFTVETSCKQSKKTFKQVWGMQLHIFSFAVTVAF